MENNRSYFLEIPPSLPPDSLAVLDLLEAKYDRIFIAMRLGQMMCCRVLLKSSFNPLLDLITKQLIISYT